MQFQSDLLQCEVVQPACVETTALGAAYLAGLAVGFWKDRDEILNIREEGKLYSPGKSEEEMRETLVKWREAVSRSRNWITA
jgi:glycerol kinase